MITKQKQKLIHALGQKKQRDLQGLFVGEGTKTICELSRRYRCVFLMYTEEWANTNKSIMPLADEKQIATQHYSAKIGTEVCVEYIYTGQCPHSCLNYFG